MAWASVCEAARAALLRPQTAVGVAVAARRGLAVVDEREVRGVEDAVIRAGDLRAVLQFVVVLALDHAVEAERLPVVEDLLVARAERVVVAVVVVRLHDEEVDLVGHHAVDDLLALRLRRGELLEAVDRRVDGGLVRAVDLERVVLLVLGAAARLAAVAVGVAVLLRRSEEGARARDSARILV